MRKKLAGALSMALAAAATAVAPVTMNAPNASAAPSAPYSWRNVRLDAGGFVSGIVFSPTERSTGARALLIARLQARWTSVRSVFGGLRVPVIAGVPQVAEVGEHAGPAGL